MRCLRRPAVTRLNRGTQATRSGLEGVRGGVDVREEATRLPGKRESTPFLRWVGPLLGALRGRGG